VTGGEIGTQFFSSVAKYDLHLNKLSKVRSMGKKRSFHALVPYRGMLIVKNSADNLKSLRFSEMNFWWV